MKSDYLGDLKAMAASNDFHQKAIEEATTEVWEKMIELGCLGEVQIKCYMADAYLFMIGFGYENTSCGRKITKSFGIIKPIYTIEDKYRNLQAVG